ncbi:hypothetical protein LguiA_009532 [Lonicera macranthoides]
MALSSILRLRRSKLQQVRFFLLPLPLLVTVLMVLTVVVLFSSRIQTPHKTLTLHLSNLSPTSLNFNFTAQEPNDNSTTTIHHQHPSPRVTVAARPPPPAEADGPYHNWELFAADYQEMMHSLKIFIYPDVSSNNSQFAHIFLPHPNPFDPKLGNYFSEHAFKLALLQSSLITPNPEEAHFFFMPFSINAMRNDPLLRAETSIADFVAQYTTNISSQFKFWNASSGSDHFYVCCHSVGRDASSKHRDLHNNAIQVTCCSSYFQRLYVTHKDFGLPQVWPRRQEEVLNPPDSRDKLVFFAGRVQNSRVRQDLMNFWGNDSSMDIFAKNPLYSYEEGFRRSRFCLHVKGYEVNTARVSDAIHYGCVPVLISNYYDLPFANVLDWSRFSIIISHEDVAFLKKILMSVSREKYLKMYKNLGVVRRHFAWHMTPKNYDSFYMTAYQLWLRRGLHRLSY